MISKMNPIVTAIDTRKRAMSTFTKFSRPNAPMKSNGLPSTTSREARAKTARQQGRHGRRDDVGQESADAEFQSRWRSVRTREPPSPETTPGEDVHDDRHHDEDQDGDEDRADVVLELVPSVADGVGSAEALDRTFRCGGRRGWWRWRGVLGWRNRAVAGQARGAGLAGTCGWRIVARRGVARVLRWVVGGHAQTVVTRQPFRHPFWACIPRGLLLKQFDGSDPMSTREEP